MTEQESAFRNDPIKRSRWREILNDDVAQEALIVAKDLSLPTPLPLDASALASIRDQSRMVGHNGCLSFLLNLAEPPPIAAPTAPASTYGTDEQPDPDYA